MYFYRLHFIGLSKERPMVIDSLNLKLSPISSFTHIYGFVEFNGFVDLQISGDINALRCIYIERPPYPQG